MHRKNFIRAGLLANLVPRVMFGLVMAYGLHLGPVIAQTCSGAVSVGSGQTCSSTVTNPSSVSVSNGGTISTTSGNDIAVTSGTVSSINNAGTVTTTTTGNYSGNGIYNFGGTITNIVNTGSMVGSAGTGTGAGNGIFLRSGGGGGATSSLNNSGSIYGNYGVYYGLNIATLINSGTITGTQNAVYGNATITDFNNSGTITGTNTSILNLGTITNLNNSAIGVINVSISGGSGAVYNGGTIGTIDNAGAIGNTLATYGINNDAGTIGTINNLGSISGTTGIRNAGTITTLINAQGISGGALTYTGGVPTNYNIIINSASSYGKLAVTSGTGSTAFGIYTGSVISANRYASVFTGVTGSNFSVSSGTYNGLTWNLSQVGTSGVWDLLFPTYVFVPSLADTQASLQNTAAALHSTYALQNSVVANSLNYDCQVFDKNNVCVSAGGRNTNVQAGGVNNVSALLIAAYRAMPEVRLGAYLDQNLSVTANNSPVNLGVNSPLFGLFAVWNENQDGTGTEIKVSGAYGQKNTTITRAVVGTSEAGAGSSTLSNSGIQAIAKYGFGLTRDAIVSPYVGIRYSQGNMGGYTEATSAAVTTPLTYSALNTNATTFMAGVHGKYKLTPEATVQASVGLESDMNTNNGSLTATGITGLTPVNFNPNPVKTRPVAMLGAYYDVEKNQRVAVTGIYRQEPFQAIGSTTALATYTVGF